MDIDVEAYYKQYGPMVFRRCKYILKDEEKARDAMQDTFVRLMRYRHKLKGQYPSSLLYRMATNVCFNMLRSEKRRSETVDDDLISFIACSDDFSEKTAVNDLINRIFSREKESTRTIAMLYWVDGLTYQQVADEVGMSVSGIRKRLRILKENVKELQEVSDV